MTIEPTGLQIGGEIVGDSVRAGVGFLPLVDLVSGNTSISRDSPFGPDPNTFPILPIFCLILFEPWISSEKQRFSGVR